MKAALPTTLPRALATSDVLASLSFALDLTEGQPIGHALRTCGIAMALADRAALPADVRRTVYHAALLKDAGCSSNAARVFQLFGGNDLDAKRDLKLVDWSRYFEAARYAVAHAAPGAAWPERARRIVALARAGPGAADALIETRCRSGARIASQLGFGPEVADAIAALDEHWDGRGRPSRLSGDRISLAARVLLLAQTLDVFTVQRGPEAALEVARQRAGRWFDPELVRAGAGLAAELGAWRDRDADALQAAMRERDPVRGLRLEGEGALGRVAEAFARIVDAKSPFTERHSRRVATLSMAAARRLGVASEPLRIAALLHDLGKLAVPNAILDKPGRLTDDEWRIVRRHPADSLRILRRLGALGEWADVAAAHHERLDGRGYHRGLDAARLPLEARLIAVADVYESLTAERPYRMPMERLAALGILEHGRGTAFDADCIDALDAALGDVEPWRASGSAETRAA